MPALLDCVHWTRVLAAASNNGSETPLAKDLAARAAEIETELVKLAGTASTQADASTSHGWRWHESRVARAEATEVAAALEQLESAVVTLAERVEIGALEGFGLDG